MKLKALLIYSLSILVILTGFGFSQETEETEEVKKGKDYFINLSLYYPISINKTKEDRVNLNLSLLYGYVGYVSGLDLALGASAISHQLKGIQICGLAGVVGDYGQGIQLAGLAAVTGEHYDGIQGSLLASVAGTSFTGFQATGLVSVAGKDGKGFQLSGFASIAGENFSGLQATGGFNIAGNNFSGIQAVGLFNITGENFRGIQSAGLFNVTGENFTGIQASGLFNIVGNDLVGLQGAPCNVAAESRGAQIGIANVAGTNKGFQLGLVNYCKEDNMGFSFGPINIARNGKIGGTVWGGNTVAATAGVKFNINQWHSIASLGFGNLEDKITESLTYGFHYGRTFAQNKIDLSPDIGYRYRDNAPLFSRSEQEPDQHILEARLILGLPLNENLNLVFGAGLGYEFDTGKNIDSGKTSPLIIAGLEFY